MAIKPTPDEIVACKGYRVLDRVRLEVNPSALTLKDSSKSAEVYPDGARELIAEGIELAKLAWPRVAQRIKTEAHRWKESVRGCHHYFARKECA
jgi:hypothetical protein